MTTENIAEHNKKIVLAFYKEAHFDGDVDGAIARYVGERGVVVLVGLALVALLVARHFLAGPGEQATAAPLPVVSVSIHQSF